MASECHQSQVMEKCDEESYEAKYNEAYYAISQGQYRVALGLLETAKKLLIASEPEFGDEDMDEVTTIELQKAYCMLKLGRGTSTDFLVRVFKAP